MKPVIDPRLGDIEDDASSTKRRTLLSIAGSLLAEISLPKLAVAWTMLIAVPGILLGLAPLLAAAWLGKVSGKITSPLAGPWPVLLLALILAIGWLAGRPLFRLAERSFWSLNSLAVQPAYALCREGLRHSSELLLPSGATKSQRATLRAATAAGAGLVVCGLALGGVLLAWPATRWIGSLSDLASPLRLVLPALANSVVVVGSYLAAAALVWGISDATMAQPRDLDEFGTRPEGARCWRIAHLSDLHVVGERYGFRIESGRSGPRGNGRLRRVLECLAVLHDANPLDAILITGDMTDCGSSAEWAEFFLALEQHPRLAERMLVLPGNHDLNVVDRANPARLDLPTSPKKRLRQIRALSAIAGLQGDRVRVIEHAGGRLGGKLLDALAPHAAAMASFADAGTRRFSARLAKLWADVFPMVLPPDGEDGLGIILLNSNAETHFSFTNALGMVSAEQARGIEIAIAQFPKACWIVALHHHLVEYPKPAKAFSERIGTALINGTWFARHLHRMADRVLVMHGHRHIDWMGTCGGLLIVSGPSPVMEATDELATYFHIHTLAVGPEGRLKLLKPERIPIAGEPLSDDRRSSLPREDSLTIRDPVAPEQLRL